MVENIDQENNSPVENAQPTYPYAEYYEAENQNLELQIRNLKKDINQDLKDELLRIQYLLNKKERELQLKELQLQMKEQELNDREARLRKATEHLESLQSPKEIDRYTITDEERLINEGKLPAHNPDGKGGLPGSKNSESIVLTQGVHSGIDRITLDADLDKYVQWDEEEQRYRANDPNAGLKFTFFAAEMAYVKKGYFSFEHAVYSTARRWLGRQVWYAIPQKRKDSDKLGPMYQGKVPFEILVTRLNEMINASILLSDGKRIENVDFRQAYENWRFKYETGTFYKTSTGDLYSILDSGMPIIRSQGNPPAYRSAGRDNLKKGIVAGQQIPTTLAERSAWLNAKGR